MRVVRALSSSSAILHLPLAQAAPSLFPLHPARLTRRAHKEQVSISFPLYPSTHRSRLTSLNAACSSPALYLALLGPSILSSRGLGSLWARCRAANAETRWRGADGDDHIDQQYVRRNCCLLCGSQETNFALFAVLTEWSLRRAILR